MDIKHLLKDPIVIPRFKIQEIRELFDEINHAECTDYSEESSDMLKLNTSRGIFGIFTVENTGIYELFSPGSHAIHFTSILTEPNYSKTFTVVKFILDIRFRLFFNLITIDQKIQTGEMYIYQKTIYDK